MAAGKKTKSPVKKSNPMQVIGKALLEIKEEEALQKYLTDDARIEIYESITDAGSSWNNVYKPVPFFEELEKEYAFFKENIQKYATIKRYFGGIQQPDIKKYIMIWSLNRLIDQDYPSDMYFNGVVSKSCDYIAQLLKEIADVVFPQDDDTKEQPKFDFDKVKVHLQTLPSTSEKIAYLLEQKTEYEQDSDLDLPVWGEKTFAEKCDLEIGKLKEILKLEKGNKLVAAKPQPTEETTTGGNPEFTTARQVLALHYLLEHCGVNNIDNTVKAKFIQFLTNRQTDAKNIRNTSIYKRLKNVLGNDNKSLKNDLSFIRQYFEDLGLQSISASITKEIANCKE